MTKLFALFLLFPQPGGSAIAVPLDINQDFIECQISRHEYLQDDPDTPGVLLCLDQQLMEQQRWAGFDE